MSGSLILWLSAGATGVSFALFAVLFLRTLGDTAGQYAAQMGEKTQRQFEEAFMFVPARKIAELGRIAAIAAFFVFFIPLFSLSSMLTTLLGIALGLAAGLFAFTLPGRYARFVRARRREKFNIQLVEALATMSNALRAGFSIHQAFESVVQAGEHPIAQEFTVLLQQMRVGMSFEEALASLERRVDTEDLTLVCTAVDIARRTGGNLTEIFDRIAETIRGRMRIEQRVKTLTAQGRFQGLIVSCMPFVLGLALTLMKPGLMIPFLTSASGLVCIALALGLVALGWICIRKIVRIAV